MKVQIQFVADKGDRNRERLVLRVLRNADIGDFILIRARFEGNQVTTEVVNTFWFPYEAVKAGDVVVVYSKSGNDKQKTIEDNRTALFLLGTGLATMGRRECRSGVALCAGVGQ